jgi:hypothetical protein
LCFDDDEAFVLVLDSNGAVVMFDVASSKVSTGVVGALLSFSTLS